MKKYTTNLIFFLAPILFIFVISEYRIRNYDTVMKQKQLYLSKKSDSIEILILGNSHAGDGVDPTQFTLNAFNAAKGSQSLYFDIEITKKYLKKMSSLKYVLISIDYHSLYFTHEPLRDFMYSFYYKLNYDDATPTFKSYNSLLYSGYGLKNGLSLLMKKPYKTEKGWVAYNKTTNYTTLSKAFGKQRVESFNKMIKKNIHNKDGIIEHLNSFILLLKNRNITPIILTLPCHENFNRHLDDEITFQNNRDISNICKKNDIVHLNYFESKLADTFFFNVDHLNEKGAQLISRKINREILQLEKILAHPTELDSSKLKKSK